MADRKKASGNVLVYYRVRDPISKDQLNNCLEDLPGERISPSLYEISTVDWDDELWEEEIEKFESLIDPQTDTLIFWTAAENELLRTCLAGDKA